MCISPILLAKTINNCKITIGSDKETINLLPKNAEHVDCNVECHQIDELNRLITTPAYMLATNLIELEKGISNSLEVLNSRITYKDLRQTAHPKEITKIKNIRKDLRLIKT